MTDDREVERLIELVEQHVINRMSARASAELAYEKAAVMSATAVRRELERLVADARRPCALRAEYTEAYAEGVRHAAAMIWQSIKQRDDGAPDWDLDEFKRPGGYFWKRGNQTEHADPFEWHRQDAAIAAEKPDAR